MNIGFNVEIFPGVGDPHIITITPIRRGFDAFHELNVIQQVAQEIQRRVQEAIRQSRHWTLGQIQQRVVGYLSALNVDQGGEHAFEDDLRLVDVTGDVLMTVMERIHQSNLVLGVFDIQWTFTIDPGIFLRGGKGLSRPKWAPQRSFSDTWIDHGVNCAAYALIRLKEQDRVHPRHLNKTQSQFVLEARALCEEFGWGEEVSVCDLKKWVEKYPDELICVVSPPCVVGQTVRGANYEDVVRYLYYDPIQHHFAACPSTRCILDGAKLRTTHTWCSNCFIAYKTDQGHPECDVPAWIRKRKLECADCGIIHEKPNECQFARCTYCKQAYKKHLYIHRCPLFMPEKSEEACRFLKPGDPTDGSITALIAYDFESRFSMMDSNRETPQKFGMDTEARYTGEVVERGFTVQKHTVDLVCVKVCFTHQEMTFSLEDGEPVRRFIEWLFAFNQGNNRVFAHNGSGYDTRLIFQCIKTLVGDDVPKLIMRGNKIMKLTYRNLSFGDTLLHLPGRLKSLAKDYKCPMQKGLFPYGFNRDEKIGYEGLVPDLKEFDSSGCKSKKEWLELKAWHEDLRERKVVWNLEKEKTLYCQDDVGILAFIMEMHHQGSMELLKLTPWIYPTAPGFINAAVNLEIQKGFIELLPDETAGDDYLRAIHQMADEQYWCALNEVEHAFCHKALRGGRTEIKRLHYCLSEEVRVLISSYNIYDRVVSFEERIRSFLCKWTHIVDIVTFRKRVEDVESNMSM
jgi:hypothetical protein